MRTPRQPAMDIDARRALLLANPVTLNGEKAAICGVRNDFATVIQFGSGLGCEWAWETVARIVATGGAFKS